MLAAPKGPISDLLSGGPSHAFTMVSMELGLPCHTPKRHLPCNCPLFMFLLVKIQFAVQVQFVSIKHVCLFVRPSEGIFTRCACPHALFPRPGKNPPDPAKAQWFSGHLLILVLFGGLHSKTL